MTRTTAELETLEHRWVPTSLLPGELVPNQHADVSTEADQWSPDAWALDTSLARNQYGLYGYGQTVAIIDSGIAYDHTALGAGFGANYRVVGGWDFAENDANPYDDGPLGFHGTHVAGIVGSDDPTYTGVSPGVDLVALRVFDDQGHSDVAWITAALWWVHEHQHAFEFPITTVNLSLGVTNVDAATRTAIDTALEVLRDDGMFLAVAAGNDFSGTTNVKFPASSAFATPVASVGAAGTLSSFSMRNSRVLAAPGESIVSTVPDYLFGFNGVTDDFLAASGTSMAAPHVAGASVLLREMHGKLGHDELDQQQLYQEFVQHADVIFDAVTGAHYWRLNLKQALDSVIGPDEATHQSMGTITTTASFAGTVHSLEDLDTFSFTPSQTGELTLETVWHGPNSQRPTVTITGTTETAPGRYHVQAGQTYTLAVAGGGSIGKYDGQLTLTPDHAAMIAAAPSARVNQTQRTWTAPASGWYDVQIDIPTPDRVDEIRIYGGDGQLRYFTTQITSQHQLQLQLDAGEQITLAVIGYSPSAEISVAGLSIIQTGPQGRVGQSVLLAAMMWEGPQPTNHMALSRPGELALEAVNSPATADEAFTRPLDPVWLDRVVIGHAPGQPRALASSPTRHQPAYDKLEESVFADLLSLLVSLHADAMD